VPIAAQLTPSSDRSTVKSDRTGPELHWTMTVVAEWSWIEAFRFSPQTPPWRALTVWGVANDVASSASIMAPTANRLGRAPRGRRRLVWSLSAIGVGIDSFCRRLKGGP
jgi:hypothetical protein